MYPCELGKQNTGELRLKALLGPVTRVKKNGERRINRSNLIFKFDWWTEVHPFSQTRSVEIAFKAHCVVRPFFFFFFFFITLEPRVERYQSLWASNASYPRNRCTFLLSAPQFGAVSNAKINRNLSRCSWFRIGRWPTGATIALREREFLIDKLLARIHFIIVMI